PAALTFTWTGGAGLAANQWSNSANWSGGVAGHMSPVAGDSLLFGTSVAQKDSSNDLAFTFKKITFQDSGYNIHGVAINLSGGVTSTSNLGTDTIAANIVLKANQTFNISGSTVIQVSGAIAGGFSLTKSGTGTVALLADNSLTFGGAMIVSAGTL